MQTLSTDNLEKHMGPCAFSKHEMRCVDRESALLHTLPFAHIWPRDKSGKDFTISGSVPHIGPYVCGFVHL